ncbi:luciferin 4-monooxygenase-like isoform X2 [Lycorma delicatula]|uniref:luciferin 4-monooxygenase-like isoform X2 n=1 Tax=Lycorma delicatula TaxID=130591 RepID=UPI003F51059C
MEEHILYGDMTEEDLNRSYESLGCMLYRSLKIKGSEIFQIDAVTGKSQTHNDVLHLSCNLAQNLKLKGLKSGDVITICCENRLEYAIPLFATLYIGVVCSPLNPAYTTDELIHSLKITRPKYLFCSEQTLPTVIAAVKRCHFITELVLISDSSVPEYNFNYKIIMFSNLIKPLHPLIRIDDFKPEEFDSHLQTAVVLCSSGTTGLPKGVKLSCANLETFIRGAKSRHSSGETERLLGLVPFYHGYGYGMILTSAVTRLQMILLSKFEEHLFLSTIEKYKVIDIENGTSLGPGAIGELCFRGPQVMQGYFNNERATKDAVDSDGWLHTGDLGYYDEEGYFYIVDRLKELIKYKGYQVAPAELEALILSLPEVKDVAVIGLPDEISGELPLAFVVKQPDSDISENDIIKFVASKVSPQKRLKGGVKFIDAIPKNPSGKILRRLLRDSLKIISKY